MEIAIYQSFEEPEVWKRSCQEAVDVYERIALLANELKQVSKMLTGLAQSIKRRQDND
jgi:hypothetical protein